MAELVFIFFGALGAFLLFLLPVDMIDSSERLKEGTLEKSDSDESKKNYIKFGIAGIILVVLNTFLLHSVSQLPIGLILGIFFLIGGVLSILLFIWTKKLRSQGAGNSVNDQLQYANGVKRLSDSALKELCSTMYSTYGLLNVDIKQLPRNFQLLFIAAGEELHKTSRSAINVVPDNITRNYCDYLKKLTNVGNRRANEAMTKGLDFGIITNNAADMALYSAMNTHEKIKNVKNVETSTMNILCNETSRYCKELGIDQ